MAKWISLVLRPLLLLAIVCHMCNGLAVMSIDLGNDCLKIAIVSPGKPMEIILNSDSSRKTPLTIAFRDGERYFNDAALTTGVRFPEKTYSHLLDLIGKKLDNPLVEQHKKRFPFHKLSHDGTTIILKHPDNFEHSVEELLAMILEKARVYAESYAGDNAVIKDAVITVPPYFTQAERKSLLRAAELAGIKVLQLMNTNTAVALNYGVFRHKDFNETMPTNILFYDMGSTSTVATVASYQVLKSNEKGFVEKNPQLTIRGVGFDRTLGGFEMQIRLRDYLAQKFAVQHSLPVDKVTSNHKAMSKLLKESGRLKKVLSANPEYVSQVENVMNDVDLKVQINRNDFEDISSDLFERMHKPIEDALVSSSLTLNDIDQIILFGGNTRIPKVQATLSEFFGEKELGKSVNSDEAAALGAAYQAAHLSKAFKVKTFNVKDANLFPIQVDFKRASDAEGTKSKQVQRVLFSRNNLYPQKKVLTFSKNTADFDFYINYGDLSQFLNNDEVAHIGDGNITKVSLSKVSEVSDKYKDVNNVESKGIKAYFRMDENGILNLDKIESLFEQKVEEEVDEGGNVVGDAIVKFGNTISKLFSRTDDDGAGVTDDSSSNDQQPKSAENVNDTLPIANMTEAAEKELNETLKANATEVPEAKKTRVEVKVKTIKEPLDYSVESLDIKSFDTTRVELIKSKLDELNAKENAKLERESLVNALESFVVETKMKLYENEYESATTEDERKQLFDTLNELSEWLEYDSGATDSVQLKEKLSKLKQDTKPMFERVTEHRGRPEALESLNNMLNISSVFLSGAKNLTQDQQIFTDVELTTLEQLINSTLHWKSDMVQQQSNTPSHQSPKLTIKSISEKISTLDREVKYLVTKARITKPKKKAEEDVKTSNETEDKKTAESEEKSSEDVVQEEQEASKETVKESKTEEKTVPKDDVKLDKSATSDDHSQSTATDDKHTEL